MPTKSNIFIVVTRYIVIRWPFWRHPVIQKLIVLMTIVSIIVRFFIITLGNGNSMLSTNRWASRRNLVKNQRRPIKLWIQRISEKLLFVPALIHACVIAPGAFWENLLFACDKCHKYLINLNLKMSFRFSFFLFSVFCCCILFFSFIVISILYFLLFFFFLLSIRWNNWLQVKRMNTKEEEPSRSKKDSPKVPAKPRHVPFNSVISSE